MKPKQIKKLRRIIQSPGYLYLTFRWQLMWKESDAWWEDWLATRRNEDMDKCIMFRERAEWYSKRLDNESKN